MSLKATIEALLFAASEPLSLNQLLKVLTLEEGESEAPLKKEALQILGALQNELREADRGIELIEVNGGYQFRTKPEYSEWIHRLNEPKPTRLSTPAVESLAIIAYRQPTTRPEMETIRGVDSGAVLKGLLERRLIKILGRKEEPGRPLLYGTTSEFLELFGLKDLAELPPLKELEQRAQAALSKESEREEKGEEGLSGLEIDPKAFESLDQQERETFTELERQLAALKESDQKTQEIIAPKPDPEESSAEDVDTSNDPPENP